MFFTPTNNITDQDNIFWYSIWRLIAAIIVTIIITAGGCSINKDRLKAESLQKGVPAAHVECVFSTSNPLLCTTEPKK